MITYEDWGKLTDAELTALRESLELGESRRQAFLAWEARQAKLRMTAVERRALYRRHHVRLPWM